MYNLSAYKSDASYISDIVRFDLPRLPALDGLHITHLQCHIGTDTLSLARLGAASVVGLDFSAESLKQARALADDTRDAGGSKLSYVQGDVYDSVKLLGHQKFDLVFTGIGALCWLPSVSRWARVVADLLKPGGRLFIREGHPILWAADDSAVSDAYPAEQLRIAYPYFENGRPIINSEGLSYVGDSTVPAEAGAGGAPSTSPKDISTLQRHRSSSSGGNVDEGIQSRLGGDHSSIDSGWFAHQHGRRTRLSTLERAAGQDGQDGSGRVSARTWERQMPCSYTIQAIKESSVHVVKRGRFLRSVGQCENASVRAVIFWYISPTTEQFHAADIF